MPLSKEYHISNISKILRYNYLTYRSLYKQFRLAQLFINIWHIFCANHAQRNPIVKF